ncbi:MAG: M15 family metallopeptidase [Bacillota bacterium]|nr:M15 family metallopeptidase [Bacillota bacterium]
MSHSTTALVRLLDRDPDFIIDLRYATANNFTGKVIYESGECYIHPGTADMLIQARNRFRELGYRVKVWDAYRPLKAQRTLWDVVPDDRFVARPPDMSRIREFRASHLNGMCVDITLTDLEGNELVMPTEFDEFGPLAGLERNDHDTEGYRNAKLMCDVMESVGFESYDNEWWHFFDRRSTPTPYLDIDIKK